MSFSKAAKELFLSPPTLRAHIKLLENELEAPLITKRNDQLEFTPTGRILLQHAHKILAASDEAVEACRSYARDSVSLLVKTYNYPAFESLLAQARTKFLKEHPSKHVGIRFSPSTQPGFDAVASGQVDISLIIMLEENDRLVELSSRSECDHVQFVPWGHGEGVFWFTEGNPLFDKETIGPADLAGQTLVLPHTSDMLGASKTTQERLARAGVSVRVENSPFQDLEEYFFSDMSGSFGLAIDRKGATYHHNPSMRTFRMDDLPLRCNLYVACNEERLNQCGTMFWEALKKEAVTHPAEIE